MLQRPSLFVLAAVLCACAESPTAADSGSTLESQFAKASNNSGEVIYGLAEGNRLITFSSDKPNQTSSSVQITGLMAGETVVGIDFRPSDLTPANGSGVGNLYAVTSASRLYVVDEESGVASNPVSLTIALVGTSFGVGFNPAVDRLRIHSDAGQNLRVNVETGATIMDAALAYTVTDVNAGKNPDVTATGYTNNDADGGPPAGTGTELYAIDVAQDVLVEFAGSPNAGQLVTVGTLGVDAGLLAGFDISNGTGIAYAALSTSPSGKSTLYSINLDTGAATKLGMLAQTKSPLLGIAVQP